MRGKPSEWSEQCAVIAWARVNQSKYPCLRWLHCSLNGVKLTLGQARKMKAAGMVAGILDLFLPYPVGAQHGLYVEMKVGSNKATEEQVEFVTWCLENGYAAQVARGFEQTVDVIVKYINGDDIGVLPWVS